MHLPILNTEPALTKETAAALEAYNATAAGHNVEVVELEKRDAELSKPADEIDARAIFKTNPAPERFRLRQAALKIRRDTLAPLLNQRAADRRNHANELAEAIEPAKKALIGKLHRLGFVGNGDRYENNVPGSIMPVAIQSHPAIFAARNAAQDAKAVADSSANEIAANADAVAGLQKLLAATVASAAA